MGEGYKPADVNIGRLMTRTNWDDLFALFLEVHNCKPDGKSVVPCFPGAGYCGCGKPHDVCDQEWKDKGYKGSSHGPIAKPRFEKLSNDPKYLLVLAGAARIGGFRGHGKKILPGDVLSAVTTAMENYRRNLDGGHSGAVGAGAPKLCSATSTEQVLSETQGAGECIGGGGLGLWCRGRNGRKAPSSLTKLEYLDRECALDALVNDADERPAPIEFGLGGDAPV